NDCYTGTAPDMGASEFCTVNALVDVPGPREAERIALSPPSPNPSSARLDLSFAVRRAGRVRLAIYDLSRRAVRVLEDRVMDAGAHTTRWDGYDARGQLASAGVYFLRLVTVDGEAVRRFVRVR